MAQKNPFGIDIDSTKEVNLHSYSSYNNKNIDFNIVSSIYIFTIETSQINVFEV